MYSWKPTLRVYIGLGLGLSSTWWTRGHNRHHAMPQRLNHDIDVDAMPLVAFNLESVKSSKDGKTFLIQNQVITVMYAVRQQ